MIALMDATAMKKYFIHYIINECGGELVDNVPCKVSELLKYLTEEQKQEQIRIFGGEEKMEKELKDSVRLEEWESLLEEYINMIVLGEELEWQVETEYNWGLNGNPSPNR
jgi:hypothetical protein